MPTRSRQTSCGVSQFDPRTCRGRLAEYARGWLEGRTDIRPTTRAKYCYLLTVTSCPYLAVMTWAVCHLHLCGVGT